mmetsp:Transcript_17043/g.47387  ORF Transcript_17043/g.47387 Transcript_17043/m.47387 type:complete len:270 (-) Transcript_17043:688-1497(-)
MQGDFGGQHGHRAGELDEPCRIFLPESGHGCQSCDEHPQRLQLCRWPRHRLQWGSRLHYIFRLPSVRFHYTSCRWQLATHGHHPSRCHRPDAVGAPACDWLFARRVRMCPPPLLARQGKPPSTAPLKTTLRHGSHRMSHNWRCRALKSYTGRMVLVGRMGYSRMSAWTPVTEALPFRRSTGSSPTEKKALPRGSLVAIISTPPLGKSPSNLCAKRCARVRSQGNQADCWRGLGAFLAHFDFLFLGYGISRSTSSSGLRIVCTRLPTFTL